MGKAASLPLARLLGGYADEVPAYASGGYYRPGDPLDAIREEISFYRERGFTDYKIKVGGASLDSDRPVGPARPGREQCLEVAARRRPLHPRGGAVRHLVAGGVPLPPRMSEDTGTLAARSTFP